MPRSCFLETQTSAFPPNSDLMSMRLGPRLPCPLRPVACNRIHGCDAPSRSQHFINLERRFDMGRKTAVCAIVSLLLAGATVYSWAGAHRSTEPAMAVSDSGVAVLLSVTNCPCPPTRPDPYTVETNAQDCWTCDPIPPCRQSWCATEKDLCITCCNGNVPCEDDCIQTAANCNDCCV